MKVSQILESIESDRSPIGRILFSQRTGWIVLAISLALTSMAWYFSSEYINRREADRFAFEAIEIEAAIKQRMKNYVQLLRAGVGLFNASSTVNRDEWHEFVQSLDVAVEFPGTQGIGVAVPIQPDMLQGHIEEMRRNGRADYTVRPAGARDLYTSIVFLEPEDWRNQRAIGFDMYSEENRHRAMQRAIDTGSVAVSAKVKLVQETDTNVQAGLLVYLPYYGADAAKLTSTASRRAAFAGMVYAVLRGTDLMKNILGGTGKESALRIYDQGRSDENLIYDSHPGRWSDFTGTHSLIKELPIYGQNWIMELRDQRAGTWNGQYWQSTLVGIGGLIVDLLLFCVIHLIGKRGRALERERYTVALERSNEDLSSFAHAASHDLKSPLRAIDQLASWIAEDCGDQLPDQSKHYLQLLQGRAKRLETLLDDLLRYSRAGNDGESLKEKVDCNELVAEVVEIANLPANFEVESQPDMPVVVVVPAVLRQVMLNLVSNAVKHHDQRAGRIRIGCDWRNGNLELQVADNGPGIAPDFHRRVFEMFTTLESRDKREGSGVGLALVKKLVNQQGGTVSIVPTQAKRGTTFLVSLPALRVKSASHVTPESELALEH